MYNKECAVNGSLPEVQSTHWTNVSPPGFLMPSSMQAALFAWNCCKRETQNMVDSLSLQTGLQYKF